MRCLHRISRTHTLSHTHRSRCGRTQTFIRNKLFSAALQFYQLNSLIAQELPYLSQQGAGNIIVSKGIKATASLLIEKCVKTVVIHTCIHSLSSLSHKWTLDKLHFSDNRILKWRSLNCKLTGVFQKASALSTVERVRAHGCQVDKNKYHT